MANIKREKLDPLPCLPSKGKVDDPRLGEAVKREKLKGDNRLATFCGNEGNLLTVSAAIKCSAIKF